MNYTKGTVKNIRGVRDQIKRGEGENKDNVQVWRDNISNLTDNVKKQT